LAEPTRRNECLDTMNYSEAAARKRGWTSMTEEQWDALAAERGVAGPDAQPDLFDASAPAQPRLSERAMPAAPREDHSPETPSDPANPPRATRREGGWIGRHRKGYR
jgi:phage terminase large subunit GpA-like protein